MKHKWFKRATAWLLVFATVLCLAPAVTLTPASAADPLDFNQVVDGVYALRLRGTNTYLAPTGYALETAASGASAGRAAIQMVDDTTALRERSFVIRGFNGGEDYFYSIQSVANGCYLDYDTNRGTSLQVYGEEDKFGDTPAIRVKDPLQRESVAMASTWYIVQDDDEQGWKIQSGLKWNEYINSDGQMGDLANAAVWELVPVDTLSYDSKLAQYRSNDNIVYGIAQGPYSKVMTEDIWRRGARAALGLYGSGIKPDALIGISRNRYKDTATDANGFAGQRFEINYVPEKGSYQIRMIAGGMYLYAAGDNCIRMRSTIDERSYWHMIPNVGLAGNVLGYNVVSACTSQYTIVDNNFSVGGLENKLKLLSFSMMDAEWRNNWLGQMEFTIDPIARDVLGVYEGATGVSDNAGFVSPATKEDGTPDVIRLPIKIYDYDADSMLFEWLDGTKDENGKVQIQNGELDWKKYLRNGNAGFQFSGAQNLSDVLKGLTVGNGKDFPSFVYSEGSLNADLSSLTSSQEYIDYLNGANANDPDYRAYRTYGIVNPVELANRFTSFNAGLGLLQQELGTGKRPVYTRATVEYVAQMLYRLLSVNETYQDAEGTTIYRDDYLKGEPNEVRYGRDENGNVLGLPGWLRLNLRHEGTENRTYVLGDYNETRAREASLLDRWDTAKYSLMGGTCMDAAYFLLNSLFVAGSYNTPSNDYDYLELRPNGNGAYVFDSGFATRATGDKFNYGIRSSPIGPLAEDDVLNKQNRMPGGIYRLVPYSNVNLAMDVSGGSSDEGANIQVYEQNGTSAQLFVIQEDGTGYYSIQNVNSGRFLNVTGGPPTQDNTNRNVMQYKETLTGDNEKWRFTPNDDGTWFISSKDTEFKLNIAGDTSGSNVQVFWTSDNNTKWYLIPEKLPDVESDPIPQGVYAIRSAIKPADDYRTYYLDVSGQNEGNRANVNIWENLGLSSQWFSIQRTTDGYYTLEAVHSGKYVDVDIEIKNNQNVQQYRDDRSPGSTQKWRISKNANGSYTFYAYNTNFVLDVFEGGTANPEYGGINGSNVQVYEQWGDDNAAQQWFLEPVRTAREYDYEQAIHYGKKTEGGDGIIRNTSAEVKPLMEGSQTREFNFYPLDDGTNSISLYGGYVPWLYHNNNGYTHNYHYVLACNGQFVYQKGLFFDFEGDDDVYLFINGKLAMDIGGAHVIDSLRLDLDNPDLVNEFGLVEGQIYSFDFFYMERHLNNANMRIETNIDVQVPQLEAEKTAYQYEGTTANEVHNNATVDPGQPVEYSFTAKNVGASPLYELAFKDDVLGIELNYNGLTITKNQENLFTKNAAGELVPLTSADDLIFELIDANGNSRGATYYEIQNNHMFPNAMGHEGYGLQENCSLVVRNMYVKEIRKMPEISASGRLTNTVDVTGKNPQGQGLNASAKHALNLPVDLTYYQWSGHALSVSLEKLAADAKTPAIASVIECNAQGQTLAGAAAVTDSVTFNQTLPNGGTGETYVKYYLATLKDADAEGNTTKVIKILLNVLDVKDSVFVLDYGLKANLMQSSGITEQDALTIPGITIGSRLEAITLQQPSYSPNHINFPPYNIDSTANEINGVYTIAANSGSSNMVLDLYEAKIQDGAKVDLYAAGIGANQKFAICATDYQKEAEWIYCTIQSISSGKYLTRINNELCQISYTGGTIGEGHALLWSIRRTGDGSCQLWHSSGEYLGFDSAVNGIAFNNGTQTWRMTKLSAISGSASLTQRYGKFCLNSDLVYTPSKFMEGKDEIYAAVRAWDTSLEPGKILGEVEITKEVEMFKKITVLPANVVYYEDDFPAITYYNSGENTITIDGTGSGSLTQSVDNSEAYGHDSVYENGGIEYSGNTIHKIKINTTGKVASFDFSGTGFELISRTNATDSATIVLKVFELSNGTEKLKETVPVITEFDNGANGGSEEIYQVPVIRREYTSYGKYRVEIWGVGAYNYGENHEKTPKTTYLYLDGIRIYNPLGSGDLTNYYSADEKNAKFQSLHTLLSEGRAAAVTVTDNVFELGTATRTFTENRNGDGFIRGNEVGNVNAYLAVGPNNEVYLRRENQATKHALVLNVKPTGANSSLQIGVHVMNADKFDGTTSAAGTPTASAYYSVLQNGQYQWQSLAAKETLTSATEQYYKIDLAKCPTNADGSYRVVICVDSGMISFTNCKTVDLEITAKTGESATLHYVNGVLKTAEGTNVNSQDYFAFKEIKAQMRVARIPGEAAPTEAYDSALSMKSASLALNSDISLIFNGLAAAFDNYEDVYVVFHAENREDVVVRDSFTSSSGDDLRYNFVYDGLTALDMDIEVSATVYGTKDGVLYHGDTKSYSVYEYCQKRMTNANANDQEKTVCANLLNYGGAAQRFKGVPADQCVNAKAEIADLVNTYASDMDRVELNKTSKVSQGEQIKFVSQSLIMDARVTLNFVMNLSGCTVDKDHVTYEITYNDSTGSAQRYTYTTNDLTENGNGGYTLSFAGLRSTEMRTMVTCTVYVNGVKEASYTNSIENYCCTCVNRAENSEQLKTLAKCLMLYGDSAAAAFPTAVSQ